MALLWIEGFEGYGNTPGNAPVLMHQRYSATARAGTVAASQIQAGRYGGYGWKRINDGGLDPRITTPAIFSGTTTIVGLALMPEDTTTDPHYMFALMAGSATETVRFHFLGGATKSVQAIGPAGTITTSSIGSTALNGGEWGYFEVKTFHSATVGTMVIRYNGVEIYSGTSLNTGTGIDRVRFGLNSAGNSDCTIDDVYICDSSGSVNNDFLGPRYVQAIFPNADGDSEQFTPSAGADNYALVDEVAVDEDTTYIESSTTNHKDLYNYSDIGAGTTGINGICVNSHCRFNSSAANVKNVVKSGATEVDGASQAAAATYFNQYNIHETDPNTASAWAASAVNGAQFGVKVG